MQTVAELSDSMFRYPYKICLVFTNALLTSKASLLLDVADTLIFYCIVHIMCICTGCMFIVYAMYKEQFEIGAGVSLNHKASCFLTVYT